MGAIGDMSVIPVLDQYTKNSIPEIAETCELALKRLKWLQSNDCQENLLKSPYMSIDPAPPAEVTDIYNLKKTLLDENKLLFDRYRAMFALRNLRTPESILALSEGKQK